jgi:hypothetical protein
MSTDNQDLVLDATDPLVRAHGVLQIPQRFAQQADHLDQDPLGLAAGCHNRLAAAQRAYSQHATVCALVALAGDVRRIADQLDHGRPPTLAHTRASGGHKPPEVAR